MWFFGGFFYCFGLVWLLALDTKTACVNIWVTPISEAAYQSTRKNMSIFGRTFMCIGPERHYQRGDVCVCCWSLCEPIAQRLRPYAPGCLPIAHTGPDREVLLSNCSWYQFGELAGLMSVWGRRAPLPVVGFKRVYQAKCNRRNAQAVFLGMLPWPGWQEH